MLIYGFIFFGMWISGFMFASQFKDSHLACNAVRIPGTRESQTFW